MSAFGGKLGIGLVLCVGLTACGGGGSGEEHLNVDYSTLRIAESRDTPLEYARTDAEVLEPLRNGLRMMVASDLIALPADTFSAAVAAQGPQSNTTVQVQGVDEADSLKYDGRYIFATRPESIPATPTTPYVSRNVLDISRTDPATAGVTHVAKFVIEGEQSSLPLLYQLQNQQGAAEFLVAVSNNYYAWIVGAQPIASLVRYPDRTTIQLLDVRDPLNVAQAWKLELDGWLRASRMIGNTLYVVSSYRPRMSDLLVPADTLDKRRNNEQRILRSAAAELLPSYAENGGARQRLVPPGRCLIAQGLANNEGYLDLLVITAIDVRSRRITDVNCLGTNVNGVYMSQGTLYIAGIAGGTGQGATQTVLHKFALDGSDITYRATGSVTGSVGWTNPSYFMDERNGDLRILTTGSGAQRLTVLREDNNRHLLMVATLPSAARPAAIGKPGEAVYAVRFVNERAYVVTFRVTDPLYVIDLANPADPAIAGELQLPGFSTYLREVGAAGSQLLLSVGHAVAADGRRGGVKVQLIDVRDIAHPQVLGAEVIGMTNTQSEALNDPHALTFLDLPGADARFRLAVPIIVFDTSHWTYSGLHLFEVAAGAAPTLHLQGVIKTEERDASRQNPSFIGGYRGVFHADSVYAIHGEDIRSSSWQNLQAP